MARKVCFRVFFRNLGHDFPVKSHDGAHSPPFTPALYYKTAFLRGFAITSTDNQIDLERGVIADFIYHPSDLRYWAAYFPVRVAAFTEPAHATAFQRLMACDLTDKGKLSRLAYNTLGIGKNGAAQNALLECASPLVSMIPVRCHQLAMNDYQREQNEAFSRASSSIGDCASASAYDSKLKHAIDSVTKPKDVPASMSCVSEKDNISNGKIDEFPAYCLHVPGFIDELTAYTLEGARKPNLTLAFAGALALLAHLSGRIFTTHDDTWTNLFVFALAGTGQGKEHPRRVIKKALEIGKLSITQFEQVASGEAVDDLIGRIPRTLLLIDEVQKLVQSFGIKNQPNVQSLIKTLMNLYTSSGSNYTTRVKASSPTGPVVVDNPSLSIFATGNAVAVYESLTPESIDEGLLGRCLMFDTDLDVMPSQVKESKPEFPKSLETKINSLAELHNRMQSGNGEATVVEFDPEAKCLINEANQECFAHETASKARQDNASKALWARAGEKIAKLSLLYAISVNVQNPRITCDAVKWAREIVHVLIDRMSRRVHEWMATSEIERLANKALKFLRDNGGSATRHNINRRIKPGSKTMMDQVEELLEDRHDITVEHLGVNRAIYTLVTEENR